MLQLIDSLAQGGAERSLVELDPWLALNGIEPVIGILHQRAGMADEARRSGIEVRYFGGGGGIVGSALRVRRELSRGRFDLLHTTLFEASLVGRLSVIGSKIPVVRSLVSTPYGDDDVERLGVLKVRVVQLVDAATARRIDCFHSNAAHVKQTMGRRLHIQPTRILVVPRGRDQQSYPAVNATRRATLRRDLGVGDGQSLLLAVSRHEEKKGLDVLIRAMSRLRVDIAEIVLMVSGREGSATGSLVSLIGDLGLTDRVRLLGYRSDVGDLLAAADVLVHPSRTEGFPGVVLEAMAVGTPIVASDLPGVREVVGPGSATLVPADDEAELAAAVVSVLGRPEKTQDLVEAARDRYLANFTCEAVGKKMADLYRYAAGR